MGPALFAITLEAMKSEVDEVALQGKIPILMCRGTLPGEIIRNLSCNYNTVIYMVLHCQVSNFGLTYVTKKWI